MKKKKTSGDIIPWDQQITDEFANWYGHHPGAEPCLHERPEQIQREQPAIEAIYQIGNLRLLIEHTSYDEMPYNRREMSSCIVFSVKAEAA